MDKIEQSSNDSQLHWFWNLTTKWWFFPLFYLTLSFLFAVLWRIISKSPMSLYIILYTLYFLPNGFVMLIPPVNLLLQYALGGLFGGIGDDFYVGFPLLALPLIILSILVIYYYKRKKNKILKWLIISLFLFLILSFLGCATNIQQIMKIRLG